MNTDTTSTTSRGLRLALRLYPAAYRAECGEEITAVHADATTGAGRLATARETAGVAAYGLRVRTGLTASGTAGRLLATTAPLAAAMALGQQLPVLQHLSDSWQTAGATIDSPIDSHAQVIANAVPGVLWLLVVGAALLRRWTTARILGALAGVAVIAPWLVSYHLQTTWAPGMPPDYVSLVASAGSGVLWAVMVFAAPGDLLDSTVGRRPRAAVLPVVLLAASIAVDGPLHLYGRIFGDTQQTDQGVGAAYLLLGLLALAFLRRGRLLPAAAGLILLPLGLTDIVLFNPVFYWNGGVSGYWQGEVGLLVSYLVGAVLLVLAMAGAVRFLGRTPSPEGSQLGAE
ncbi:hypothetical protein [Kitasatospora mediocidica]|uniref:hypothetical protein n=1 Tax=Kitasatospora mediocidica TaxID=58352 RepID=UPI000564CAEA|nr:hypothetical protein [Kitasatospora mediocidica]